MCRNIRRLYNFEPAATEEELRDAALQFVRKISGFNKPSNANSEAFYCAVDEISDSLRKLLDGLTTTAPKRDRAVEIAKLKARSAKRFAPRD
jgi:hypothetical protein